MTTQIFDDNCSLCRDCEKVLLTREELDTITDRLAREIEDTYRDPMKWSRMAVLNVANSGYFSSDRSIEDYLERIWHTGPLK